MMISRKASNIFPPNRLVRKVFLIVCFLWENFIELRIRIDREWTCFKGAKWFVLITSGKLCSLHTSSEPPEFDAFRGMKRPSQFRCCNFTIRRAVNISDKLCQYQKLSRKHSPINSTTENHIAKKLHH